MVPREIEKESRIKLEEVRCDANTTYVPTGISEVLVDEPTPSGRATHIPFSSFICSTFNLVKHF